MSDGQSLHHYFMLRGAMLRKEKFPWQLNEAEQAELAQRVAREEQLVVRVLALPQSRDVAVTEDELQQAVEAFLEGVAELGEVDGVLHQSGLQQQSLRAAIATEMVVAEVLERITAAVAPSEEEVYRWYQTHPEQFTVPERREVFQILITVNDEYADNCRDAAQQRIDEVARLAQASPERFGALALSHSECPSAVESGRLGIVPPGHLYPELDRALFALESGAVSNVLESPLGFHLLRCGDIEAARHLGWDEVKEPLTRRLTQHKLKRYFVHHQS